MVQRGYPGIHAGMPTPQCLRSAIVVNGAPKSTSAARRPDSRPGSWWDRVSPVGDSMLQGNPATVNLVGIRSDFSSGRMLPDTTCGRG
ncbi:hypothetical protein DZG01_19480 [Pseudomonas fluorescens]|nr:hypothetical protein DZG01_19480 [Pseudomonas fluorescens]